MRSISVAVKHSIGMGVKPSGQRGDGAVGTGLRPFHQRDIHRHRGRQLGQVEAGVPPRGGGAQHVEDHHVVLHRLRLHGQVVSDEGWSAPLRMFDGLNWYLKREIPNWETCPDGSSFPATDYIMFYPANPETGENTLGSSLLSRTG